MTRIGILCLPLSGHLNPMMTVGQELQRRGHHVTVFNIPDMESEVLAEGLNFHPVGQSDYPLGTSARLQAKMGQLKGLAEMRFGTQVANQLITTFFRNAPSILKEHGVEMLLVDQNESTGGTIADYLGIPFINICCALPNNREVGVPPDFTPWEYRRVWWAYLRNQLGYMVADWVVQSCIRTIIQQRQQWNLPPYRQLDDRFSRIAQISQLTADFDFPRQALPNCFHYTGLFRSSSVQNVPFPYGKLTNQPLIYASLGTLYNRKPEVFYCIAAACAGLDAQLVIALGRGNQMENHDLPGNPLVVEYAPQLQLLSKARMTITHGGLNTVSQSLANGVPLVAIPLAADQAASGKRLLRTGAGEVVPRQRLSVESLRTTVQKVLTAPSYIQNAARLQTSIQKAGGLIRASDIIEQAIATGKPVLAGQG